MRACLCIERRLGPTTGRRSEYADAILPLPLSTIAHGVSVPLSAKEVGVLVDLFIAGFCGGGRLDAPPEFLRLIGEITFERGEIALGESLLRLDVPAACSISLP